jgi:hypothetical protein
LLKPIPKAGKTTVSREQWRLNGINWNRDSSPSSGKTHTYERIDNVSGFQLPEKFQKWAYDERAQMVRKMASGESVQPDTLFLGFTRHNPTFISHGPEGLNGSIKGVGFLPKKVL